MRADRFKPGGLAWLRPRARDGEVAWSMLPGMPLSICHFSGEPAHPVAVIRRALCGDYPSSYRRRVDPHAEMTPARYYAQQSWLVLIAGKAHLVKDKFLNKRHYTPRKPRGKCVTAGTDGA